MREYFHLREPAITENIFLMKKIIVDNINC